jgi:hypothetical protein
MLGIFVTMYCDKNNGYIHFWGTKNIRNRAPR